MTVFNSKIQLTDVKEVKRRKITLHFHTVLFPTPPSVSMRRKPVGLACQRLGNAVPEIKNENAPDWLEHQTCGRLRIMYADELGEILPSEGV